MEESATTFLKIRLFLSFHNTQTHASQITFKRRCEARDIPTIWINWKKWSVIEPGKTTEISSQWHTKYQIVPKTSQPMNKWTAVSMLPHPPTHKFKWRGKMKWIKGSITWFMIFTYCCYRWYKKMSMLIHFVRNWLIFYIDVGSYSFDVVTTFLMDYLSVYRSMYIKFFATIN